MKMFAVAVLAAMGAALSGCATVIKGETQTVTVASPPAVGARCALFTADQYYGDLLTPGAITIPRSRQDITVACTRRGFKDASATVSSDFNFVTLGNAVIGGLIGVTVDATTGANDSYPHEIEIPMEPAPRPAMTAPGAVYSLPNPSS
jgi:hypothetical protein